MGWRPAAVVVRRARQLASSEDRGGARHDQRQRECCQTSDHHGQYIPSARTVIARPGPLRTAQTVTRAPSRGTGLSVIAVFVGQAVGVWAVAAEVRWYRRSTDMTQKSSTFPVLMCGAVIITACAAAGVSFAAQSGAPRRPDLTGQWQLNPYLSDDAREKLQSMDHGSGDTDRGGHGLRPSRRVRRHLRQHLRWRASGARTVGGCPSERANQVRPHAGRSDGRHNGTKRTRANPAHV